MFRILEKNSGLQVRGFRRTLEVEQAIDPNRKERLKPLALFRALHLFEVKI